jgi:hypothetical protein
MKFLYLSIIFCFIFSTFSFSKENLKVKDVIDKYSNFKGLNKLNKKNDISFTGFKIENAGNKNKISFKSILPDKNRLDLTLGIFTNKVVENGDDSWVKMGNMNSMQIDSFNKTIIYIFKNAVFGPNINNPKSNIQLYENEEQVSGTDCYKLLKNNSVEIYIAKEDFRVVKVSEIRNFGKNEDLVEIYFDNYKDFDGIKFPTKISSYIGQKDFIFTIDNIIYDSGLTDFEFSKPN